MDFNVLRDGSYQLFNILHTCPECLSQKNELHFQNGHLECFECHTKWWARNPVMGKIPAIKLLRVALNSGLKEAKEIIESVPREHVDTFIRGLEMEHVPNPTVIIDGVVYSRQ